MSFFSVKHFLIPFLRPFYVQKLTFECFELTLNLALIFPFAFFFLFFSSSKETTRRRKKSIEVSGRKTTLRKKHPHHTVVSTKAVIIDAEALTPHQIPRIVPSSVLNSLIEKFINIGTGSGSLFRVPRICIRKFHQQSLRLGEKFRIYCVGVWGGLK